ncbi:MAG: Glyoxalase-like domain protein [Gemmatimonadetes bacterium]|nr:Glyoxalase-like domain protein [Gemmatimonadota bacterium]
MTADSNTAGNGDRKTERAEPESLRGRALMASLTVRDVGKSLDWYTRVLGFTLDNKYEHEGKVVGASLKAGDVRILLNQDDGKKGERQFGVGFSMMITTTQSVDEVASRVKAAGGALQSEPADMPWGARVFGIVDPENGYRWTVSSS